MYIIATFKQGTARWPVKVTMQPHRHLSPIEIKTACFKDYVDDFESYVRILRNQEIITDLKITNTEPEENDFIPGTEYSFGMPGVHSHIPGQY